MPSSNPNSKGPGNSPAPSGSASLTAPNTFCVFCCQLFKKGEQENIMPAITWVPINVAGLWVTVPTCMGHLELPGNSPLIH
jgi:hypothetical protein